MAVNAVRPVDAWAHREIRVPIDAEATPFFSPPLSPPPRRAAAALRTAAIPPNIQVNDPFQVPAGANDITPAVGVIGNKVLIVWSVRGATPAERLRASFSEDGGVTYTDAGWLPPLSGDWRWGPDPCVAADPLTNTFFVVAQSANPAESKQGIMFATAQVSAGIQWGTPVLLRETAWGGVYYVNNLDLQFDVTFGSLDLVFRDGLASPALLTHQVSWDRGATWSAPATLVSDPTGPSGLVPTVAWNSNWGRIVASWDFTGWETGTLRTRRILTPGSSEPPVTLVTARVDNGSLPGTFDRANGTSLANDRTFYRFQNRLYAAWIASCGFASPPVPAGTTVSETEPNDTPGTAQPIATDVGWLDGSFTPASDADYASLFLNQGQRLVVRATSIDSAGLTFVEPAVQIEVIAQDGTHGLNITSLGRSSIGDASLLFTAPRSGAYTLRITGVNATTYQLSFAYPPFVSTGLDRRDLYVSTSASGELWSFPALVYTSPPGFDMGNPRMIVANDGRPYVFWQDWSELDPDGAIMSVRVTRSNDGGVTWETPRTLSSAGSDWQSVPTSPGHSFKVGWRMGAATTPIPRGEVPSSASRAPEPARPQGAAAETPEERVHVVWTDGRSGQGDILTASFPTGFEVLHRTTDTTATPGEVLGLHMVLQNRNTVFPLWLHPDPPSCTRNWSSIQGSFFLDPGQTVSTWPIAVLVPDTAAAGTVLFQGSLNSGPDSYGINTFIHVLPPTAAVGGGNAALSFAAPGPNPATSHTSFRFGLPESADVTLELFDVSGARVRTLFAGHVAAGTHARGWDLRDDAGRPVSAGVYLSRLTAGSWTAMRRIAVVR